MGKLNQWAKENSRFFKIADGETVTVVFEGYKIGKSSFDPERDVVAYTLKTAEGRKVWNTSSSNVAEFFDKVKPSQTVSITRDGIGRNTKYQLSVVGEAELDDSPKEPEPNQSES